MPFGNVLDPQYMPTMMGQVPPPANLNPYGVPIPNKGNPAPPGWWNNLSGEQDMLAPMAPKIPMLPTGMVPMTGRSWSQDIPYSAFLAPQPSPDVPPETTPKKTMVASTSPAPTDEGNITGSIPTGKAAVSGYQPDWNQLLMRMGLQLAQPYARGQTAAGRLGEVGLGGLDWLEAQRRLSLAEGQKERQVTAEETTAKAHERVATAEEKKVAAAAEEAAAERPSKVAKQSAEAKAEEAKAALYDRSAGRGTANQPKTQEDLRSSMIKKLDLTLMDPKDLPGVQQSIDYFVKQSGLPSAAEAATQQQSTANKPWPKDWQTAVQEIKAANKSGLTPSQKLQIETQLKSRYPNYKLGSFD